MCKKYQTLMVRNIQTIMKICFVHNAVWILKRNSNFYT